MTNQHPHSDSSLKIGSLMIEGYPPLRISYEGIIGKLQPLIQMEARQGFQVRINLEQFDSTFTGTVVPGLIREIPLDLWRIPAKTLLPDLFEGRLTPEVPHVGNLSDALTAFLLIGATGFFNRAKYPLCMFYRLAHQGTLECLWGNRQENVVYITSVPVNLDSDMPDPYTTFCKASRETAAFLRRAGKTVPQTH